jgi:hypothetical protein
MTEARGIRLRGEHGISRKTIVQGMPECSDCTCMLVCALLAHFCTRDRGCSKHPAFPAPSFLGEMICKARAKRAAGTRRCVQPSSQGMDFQWLWIDPGEMLPVISDPSSEMRQAATPKNAVSIKAATSKIIEEKWPTPWPRNRHCTQSQRTSTVCRVGKCSRADLNEVFPRRGNRRWGSTTWSGKGRGLASRNAEVVSVIPGRCAASNSGAPRNDGANAQR